MGNPPYFSPVSCDTLLVVPIIVWQRICSYHLYFDVEDSGSQIIDYLIGSVLYAYGLSSMLSSMLMSHDPYNHPLE